MTNEEVTEHKGKSAAMWTRWLLLLGYAIVLYLVWMNKDTLLGWIKSGEVSLGTMLLIVTGVACVPVIPFSVVIGTMGYVYGPLLGAVISLIGAWLAALIVYGVFRYVLRDKARLLLGRHRLTEQWTSLVERHPFRSIMLARLMPIVPQQAINLYSAAVPIPFVSYAGASLIGKMPSMFMFAFIGGRLSGDKYSLFIAIGVYTGFVLLLFAGSRMWLRRGGRTRTR